MVPGDLRGGGVALFARENELESVCALLGRPGTGGALVLRGEAGVGKSTLLNEVISAGGGRYRPPDALRRAGTLARADPPAAIARRPGGFTAVCRMVRLPAERVAFRRVRVAGQPGGT